MTIGEQIIAAIAKTPLVRVTNGERNDYDGNAVLVWQQSAAEQLEAVVEAHVAERAVLKTANLLGWRQLGSLWRDPIDGKQWAWTTDQLMQEITARAQAKSLKTLP